MGCHHLSLCGGCVNCLFFLLSLCVDGKLFCAEDCTQVTGVMAMMMNGRVLLVYALCVLWCGAAVVESVVDGVVDGGVKEGLLGDSQSGSRDEKAAKPELSKSADENLGSADHSLDTRSGNNVNEQGNLVNEPPTENVGKKGVEGEGKELPVTHISRTKDKVTLPQTSPPPTPAGEEPQATSPSQASGVDEGDGGPVGIEGTDRNVSDGSLVGASDGSRGTRDKKKILKEVKVAFPGHLPVVLLHLPFPTMEMLHGRMAVHHPPGAQHL
ncbi:mucin-associated surface protein (MASP) [Trypanosoma cruzi]|nr:mucin-associated surface protein (MASP) [Trypanosoma cruzi]